MTSSTRRILAARTFVAILGAALLSAAPLAAQIPGLSPTPTPAPEVPGDPYKRETPYGAFLGFMRAAAKENWTDGGRVPPVAERREDVPRRTSRAS